MHPYRAHTSAWLWCALPFFLASFALGIYSLVLNVQGVDVIAHDLAERESSSTTAYTRTQQSTELLYTRTFVLSDATVTRTKTGRNSNPKIMSTSDYTDTYTYRFTSGSVGDFDYATISYSLASFTPALATSTLTSTYYYKRQHAATPTAVAVQPRAPVATAQPPPPPAQQQLTKRLLYSNIDYGEYDEFVGHARIIKALYGVKLACNVAVLALLVVAQLIVRKHDSDDESERASKRRVTALWRLRFAFVIAALVFVAFGVAAFVTFADYYPRITMPTYFIGDVICWTAAALMLIVLCVSMRADVHAAERRRDAQQPEAATTSAAEESASDKC